MSQQQWTPEQRRQQIAEMLRNKGVICRDFLLTGRCPRTPTCPYMHIANGETRPVPWSLCTFFLQGKCLRDRCSFFHGTQAQLEELHAAGATVYRPQDYMKVAVPPAEYLNPDGSIASFVSVASVPAQPQALHMVHGPTMSHENAVNSFHPVLLMQHNPQPITQSIFAPPAAAPNQAPPQFSFYTNTPLAQPIQIHPPGTVFQSHLHAVQPAAYYQPTGAALVHPQHYATSVSFAPHPHPQPHPGPQSLGGPVYFHVQPQ
ncbi:Zinc finger C-x8-C-x5-C-x3-H type (and similar) [Novymonas esmeraldas]|uniref:Zinc finger C-x8-C-x5-C-x3-H type (And similar) n=1 Tax=Novymonas esmeraldas TaxID=1808958 RepID=A0AAW0EYN3_9TRYP